MALPGSGGAAPALKVARAIEARAGGRHAAVLADARLQGAARAMEPKQGLVVTVDRRGRIFIDQASFAYDDFRAAFQALVARRKPSAVYLRADRGVPYGEVVRVLAVIRTAGVQDVGLVAETEQPSP